MWRVRGAPMGSPCAPAPARASGHPPPRLRARCVRVRARGAVRAACVCACWRAWRGASRVSRSSALAAVVVRVRSCAWSSPTRAAAVRTWSSSGGCGLLPTRGELGPVVGIRSQVTDSQRFGTVGRWDGSSRSGVWRAGDYRQTFDSVTFQPSPFPPLIPARVCRRVRSSVAWLLLLFRVSIPGDLGSLSEVVHMRILLRAFIGIAVGLILAALIVGAVNSYPAPAGAFWSSSSAVCTTDTDCQRKFGGDGSPD